MIHLISRAIDMPKSKPSGQSVEAQFLLRSVLGIPESLPEGYEFEPDTALSRLHLERLRVERAGKSVSYQCHTNGQELDDSAVPISPMSGNGE